jgi:hypothetical protein
VDNWVLQRVREITEGAPPDEAERLADPGAGNKLQLCQRRIGIPKLPDGQLQFIRVISRFPAFAHTRKHQAALWRTFNGVA